MDTADSLGTTKINRQSLPVGDLHGQASLYTSWGPLDSTVAVRIWIAHTALYQQSFRVPYGRASSLGQLANVVSSERPTAERAAWGSSHT